MENEKRLIPCGEKCTLDELPCGTLFAFGDDCIAVKSEYRCNNGLIEAFIIDSGEQFWGGVHTAKEQNALMVQPLEIEEVDAVELPKGKPGDYLEWDNGTGFKQIYHIHSVMICEDCMRYELEKFAPVVNHKNIVRIMSREEAEKEWHERCAMEKTQEEPTLTATEIDFDYEAED